MLKEYVARAHMISLLEQWQLEKIHEIETRKGYLLANWNIFELFGLPELKDRYCIPEDSELQSVHNKRIENEINALNLRATPEVYENKLDWWHAYDWNVYHAKNQIIWDYTGSGRKSKQIKEMLKGGSLVLLCLLCN